MTSNVQSPSVPLGALTSADSRTGEPVDGVTSTVYVGGGGHDPTVATLQE